jgi:hypothetical protein
MKLDLFLDLSSSKFFVKMIQTKGCKKPKNWSQDRIGGSIPPKKKGKKEKKVKTETEDSS